MSTVTKAVKRVLNAMIRVVLRVCPLERILDLENHVHLAYRLVLHRSADPGGVQHYKQHISGQQLPKAFVFEALTSSPEYKKAQNPLSYVRTQLVRRLPHADVIVDFGGATKHMVEGALYAMGYAQKWKKLIVVDLPNESRDDQWKGSGPDAGVIETPNGPVQHIAGSMTDSRVFEAGAFADMVWSGNAIEHITEDDADRFLQNVYDILKPDGLFCLDTPNRNVTRIQLPEQYTNPDHKIEYTHAQLSAKLKKHGFRIEQELGVLDCARFVERQAFLPAELPACPDFASNIENGYFLFYQCRKGASCRGHDDAG